MKVAVLIVLTALAAVAATTLTPFDDKEILWTKCINISTSSAACVSLFAVPENVTFGFEFALDNIVVDFPLIAGNETCVVFLLRSRSAFAPPPISNVHAHNQHSAVFCVYLHLHNHSSRPILQLPRRSRFA